MAGIKCVGKASTLVVQVVLGESTGRVLGGHAKGWWPHRSGCVSHGLVGSSRGRCKVAANRRRRCHIGRITIRGRGCLHAVDVEEICKSRISHDSFQNVIARFLPPEVLDKGIDPAYDAMEEALLVLVLARL